MRYAKTTLLSGLLFLLLAAPALGDAACPTWQAERDVRQARRAHARAERRLAEAKRVLAATRTYSAAYGANVGRWTRLARRVGWQWGCFPTLMLVIDRESGGDPHAANPTSSARGLVQLMGIHWEGRFDPFDPRANLSYGLKLYRGSGWSPWSM